MAVRANLLTSLSHQGNQQSSILGARSHFWMCLVLTLLTLLVYFQTGDFDFINYDDPAYVTANPYVLKGISIDTLKWFFLGEVGSNWHPVTLLSHLLDVTLYGMNAGAHHLTNVQFHIVNTLLLFLVFYRLEVGLWASAFIAAVFALHPLHVESVAWISERKDVLSTCFWFLTMLSYIGYTRKPSRFRYWRTILLFVLGLLAKPMLVTLPFVLLLIDFWPLQRMTESREETIVVWIEKIPFFFITLCFSIITYFIQNLTGAVSKIDQLPWFVRAANAAKSYIIYLVQTFWPSPLSVFYPYPKSFQLYEYLGSSFLLLSISLFFWLQRKRIPYGFVGWFWFVGTLIPVIGLVQVGLQAHADRYMYVPMTGIALLVACGASEFVRRNHHLKPVVAIFGILVVAAITFQTDQRVQKWKNSLTLFSDALQHTEDNATAYFCVAAYHQSKQHTEEAEAFYHKALQLTPDDPLIHINLVTLYHQAGKIELAEHHFQRLMQCNSHKIEILKSLGRIYIDRKEWDQAKNQLSMVVARDPMDGVAYNYLGIAEAETGNLFEALNLFKFAVQLEPQNAMIHNNLAVNYRKLSRIQDAVSHFAQALSLEPDNQDYLKRYRSALIERKQLRSKADILAHQLSHMPSGPEAYMELSFIYRSLQDFSKELQLLEELSRQFPDFEEGVKRLGIAYAEKGNYPKALEVFQRLSASKSHNPEWDYRIATILARMNDPSNACMHLEKAIQKGYTDLTKIPSDLNFHPIQHSECFQSIIQGMVHRVNHD
ncbi:MAG: tetratricopeptide repeat protein [Thermodesulfobacteriota bacterium]